VSGTSSRRLCHVATFERGLNDEVGSSIKLPLQLNRGDRAGRRTAEKSISQIGCSQSPAREDQAPWIVSAVTVFSASTPESDVLERKDQGTIVRLIGTRCIK
jgi:hypothetical protein